MKIELFNRDRAYLCLVKTDKKISDNIYSWKLEVDDIHPYVLQYCRYIMDDDKSIGAIDPSGGPFMSIGDTFEHGKYKIVKLNGIKDIWISEGNNN